ncbi:N-6 DNA methylase [Nocardia farcinica]|uniref:N-6 DNA methylase n=1 Tax=Nocardia farcinica TaxID=37329 RepID=UPI00245603B0|nr:N-6 DNA methylase [Nocardia farcinica]
MSRSANAHSMRIAERAATVWYGKAAHIAQRHEIAIGVVASASLIRMDHRNTATAVAAWEALDGNAIRDSFDRIWTYRWLEQPYLVHAARLLRDWISEDHASQTWAAARALMIAVLEEGILELTGSEDPAQRCDADVLGAVVTHMRAGKARTVLGEHHTPPDIAATLAAILAGGQLEKLPAAGSSFADICAGTGGLLRATADRIRQLGGDPADYRWHVNDLDPLAAACSAVNAITWGLGNHVLVSCADALVDGNCTEREIPVREAALAHHARVVRDATRLATALQLTKEVA